MRKIVIIAISVIILLITGSGFILSQEKNVLKMYEKNVDVEQEDKVQLGLYKSDISELVIVDEDTIEMLPFVYGSSTVFYEYEIKKNIVYATNDREILEFELLDNKTLKLGDVIYSYEDVYEE